MSWVVSNYSKLFQSVGNTKSFHGGFFILSASSSDLIVVHSRPDFLTVTVVVQYFG